MASNSEIISKTAKLAIEPKGVCTVPHSRGEPDLTVGMCLFRGYPSSKSFLAVGALELRVRNLLLRAARGKAEHSILGYEVKRRWFNTYEPSFIGDEESTLGCNKNRERRAVF